MNNLGKDNSNFVHGMSNTRFYRTWASMLRRCDNATQDSFKFYGARGIKVCKRWYRFSNFRDDMYKTYIQHSSTFSEHDTTLDRVNVNVGYSKENCRWATLKEQARNRRNNRYILYKGESKSLASWAEEYGLTYAQLKLRLRRGWNIERALTTKRLINQFI